MIVFFCIFFQWCTHYFAFFVYITKVINYENDQGEKKKVWQLCYREVFGLVKKKSHHHEHQM